MSFDAIFKAAKTDAGQGYSGEDGRAWLDRMVRDWPHPTGSTPFLRDTPATLAADLNKLLGASEP